MINLQEAQELHEAIGAAIEHGDSTGLFRARQIAAVLVSDLDEDPEEDDDVDNECSCGGCRDMRKAGR